MNATSRQSSRPLFKTPGGCSENRGVVEDDRDLAYCYSYGKSNFQVERFLVKCVRQLANLRRRYPVMSHDRRVLTIMRTVNQGSGQRYFDFGQEIP